MKSSDVEDLGEGDHTDVALFGRAAFFYEAAGARHSAKKHSDGSLGEIHTSGDSWYGPLCLVAEIPDSFVAIGN